MTEATQGAAPWACFSSSRLDQFRFDFSDRGKDQLSSAETLFRLSFASPKSIQVFSLV